MQKSIIICSLLALCSLQSLSAACANGRCGMPQQNTYQQTQYDDQQQYQPQYYPEESQNNNYNDQNNYQQPSYSQNSPQAAAPRGRYTSHSGYPANPDYDRTIPEHDSTWGHRDRPYYYNDTPKPPRGY